MNILTIGDNSFDIRVRSSTKVKEDENIIPESFSVSPGGTGINFSVAYSLLGGRSSYLTPVSLDPFGECLIRYLEEHRVTHIGSRSLKNTALIINLIGKSGSRSTLALIKNTAYTDVSFDEFKDRWSKFEHLYISGGILTEERTQEELMRIIEFARTNHVRIYFDPQIRIGIGINGFMDAVGKIVTFSDIVLGNIQEMGTLPPGLLKEVEKGGTILVYKKGKEGAEVHFRGKIYRSKGIRVVSVDTVGAGDIFNAAFLGYYLEDGGIVESLEFANRIAAVSTTRGGFFVPDEKF